MPQVPCKIERNTLKLKGSSEMAVTIASSPLNTSARLFEQSLYKVNVLELELRESY